MVLAVSVNGSGYCSSFVRRLFVVCLSFVCAKLCEKNKWKLVLLGAIFVGDWWPPTNINMIITVVCHVFLSMLYISVYVVYICLCCIYIWHVK